MFFGNGRQNFVLTGLVLLLSVFLVTVGCSGNAIGEDGEPAVSVDDEVITQGEIDEQVDQAFKQQAQMMEMRGQSINAEQEKMLRERIRSQVVEQSANRLVLLSAAKKSGIEITDQEVDKFLTERMPNPEQRKAALLQLGETEKEGRANLKEMLLIQKLMEQKMGDIKISDEAARTHFEENKEQYNQPEQVKARHILIKTEEITKEEAEKKLQSIKSKIEAGNADFAEMAKKHSEGPSGERGGDLGYFSRGQMVPSFEEAAFVAEPGEIVGPVETQFGLHLIKVEDKKQSSQAKFEDVKEQIKQRLLQQRQRQKAQQIIEDLRAKSDVEIAEQ